MNPHPPPPYFCIMKPTNTNMQKQMKAIEYTSYGAPDVLHLKDMPIPTPKPNEVLIRIRPARNRAACRAAPVDFCDKPESRRGKVWKLRTQTHCSIGKSYCAMCVVVEWQVWSQLERYREWSDSEIAARKLHRARQFQFFTIIVNGFFFLPKETTGVSQSIQTDR